MVDFLAYRPSEIAAAALLCAADELPRDRADAICTFDKLIEKVKNENRNMIKLFLLYKVSNKFSLLQCASTNQKQFTRLFFFFNLSTVFEERRKR